MVEFKVITGASVDCSTGRQPDDGRRCMEHALNKLGRDGWRLSGVIHGGSIDRVSVILLERTIAEPATVIPAPAAPVDAVAVVDVPAPGLFARLWRALTGK